MKVSRRRLLQSLGTTSVMSGLAGCVFGRGKTCPAAEDSLSTTVDTTQTSLDPLDEAWPMGRNDAAGTGYTDRAGPQRDVEHSRLFTGAGSFYPSVVIGNGRVYVTSRQAELLALDPVSGNVDWRYEQVDSGGARAAVMDDLILVTSRNGLHAVETATGGQRWRLDEAFDGEQNLLIDDRTAYTSTQEEIVAVDIDTGEVNWRVGGYSLGAVADSRVYISVGTGLQVVAAEDGRNLWHTDDENIVGETVAVRDGTVYTNGGAQWGHLFSDPGRLYALDTADGSQQWLFQDDETQGFESLAVAPDIIAFSTGYGSNLHVLDRQNGQQRWCVDFRSRRVAPVVIAEDVIYVVAGDAIQARRADNGDPLWTKQVDADERLGGDDDEPEFYHHHALSGDVLIAVGYGKQGLVVDAFVER